MQRRIALLLCLASFLSAAPPSPQPVLPLAVRNALYAITPANLKGDLSFLSSDALEGRYSPSPGLNIAAEFIASQFRAAGLEPAVNGEYFQVAHLLDRRMKPLESDLTLISGGKQSSVPKSSLRLSDSSQAVHIERCPVLVFRKRDPGVLKGTDLAGKAVIAPAVDLASLPESEREAAYERSQAFDAAVAAGKARIEIISGPLRTRGGNRPRLIDPAKTSGQIPFLIAESDDLKRWFDGSPSSAGDRFVSVDLPAPDDKPVELKNVIGILRGSDPKLKDTYVLLTAHYDHIGTVETGNALSPHKPGAETKDRIYNGANDDGSGAVSVIEIARSLATLKARPKRTLVFMTFFGEERGDIGSHYYAAHPVFPLDRTIADLNLEQIGRTDATDGKQLSNATLTGFDYSDVTRYLQNAGRQTGVTIYLNKEGSDAYFERSDNAALAEAGVPAHTLCVAFDYPDYHGLADEWQKVDYANMAKVDRTIALASINLANALRPPRWNAANPKTAGFRTAQLRH